jgi:hypothetical protein
MLGVRVPFETRALCDEPGQQIKQFLYELKTKHLAVEIDRILVPLDPAAVGPERPAAGVFKAAHLADRCCGDEARAKIIDALPVFGESPRSPIQPDYCVFHVNDNGTTDVLWVSSNPHDLQMRYYCNGVLDQCRIDPTAGDVGHNLAGLFDDAPSVLADKMLKKCENEAFDLLSIDPKQTTDVLGLKRWNVLGKVNLSKSPQGVGQSHYDALMALGLALEERPAHTAYAFTPRLALSIWISPESSPTGPKMRHVLLMSFECRLAQLYVGDDFKGCFAISNTGADQILNNILISAGKPLKLKSASSGN